jgi:hypothetical protein
MRATLSEYQRTLPPETKPGFSISHSRESAWAWVSTRPVSSKTGSSAAAQTGLGGARDVADQAGYHESRPEAGPVLVAATNDYLRAGLEPHLPGRGFGNGTGHLVRGGHPPERSRVEVGGGEHLLRPVFAPHIVEHGGRRVGVVDHRLAG